MLIISKYSSLYFGKEETWQSPFDMKHFFCPRFAVGDELRIQFSSRLGFSLQAKVIDEDGVDTDVSVELLKTINEFNMCEAVFTASAEGRYTFYLYNNTGNSFSSKFQVLPLEKLKDNTVLLTYTHRRDEYDTIFKNPNGTNKMFNFRVDGGLYPGDRVLNLDNETFRDQRFDLHEISAEAYETSVLTVGLSTGVPVWVGNRVNHIFNLSDIMIDSVPCVRSEKSTPELNRISNCYPLYVFKLEVEMGDKEQFNLIYLLSTFDFTFNETFF
ncbi:MAG: hypothetical protein LBS54_04100 [Dysgonamonadaceae bacterium]|jgi:hypothetical protein|nr:hypothetical protein [Dysgonamonadaceae bacterium]